MILTKEIDDDTDVCTVLLYEIQTAGHEVRAAGDRAEGLALHRAVLG